MPSLLYTYTSREIEEDDDDRRQNNFFLLLLSLHSQAEASTETGKKGKAETKRRGRRRRKVRRVNMNNIFLPKKNRKESLSVKAIETSLSIADNSTGEAEKIFKMEVQHIMMRHTHFSHGVKKKFLI